MKCNAGNLTILNVLKLRLGSKNRINISTNARTHARVLGGEDQGGGGVGSKTEKVFISYDNSAATFWCVCVCL